MKEREQYAIVNAGLGRCQEQATLIETAVNVLTYWDKRTMIGVRGITNPFYRAAHYLIECTKETKKSSLVEIICAEEEANDRLTQEVTKYHDLAATTETVMETYTNQILQDLRTVLEYREKTWQEAEKWGETLWTEATPAEDVSVKAINDEEASVKKVREIKGMQHQYHVNNEIILHREKEKAYAYFQESVAGGWRRTAAFLAEKAKEVTCSLARMEEYARQTRTSQRDAILVQENKSQHQYVLEMQDALDYARKAETLLITRLQTASQERNLALNQIYTEQQAWKRDRLEEVRIFGRSYLQ